MNKILPLLIIYPFLVAFNLCDEARINAIYLEKENSFEERDVCSSKNERVQEIFHIHQKISKTLGLPLEKIFPEKINITLRETVAGAFASYASRNNVSVGVYPGHNFDFDQSIYIHELAHLIARNENLQKINKSILFTEMFADFFALVVSQNVIEPSTVKSCFDRLRYINEGQSFNVFEGYFSQLFSMKRAQKCCESSYFNREILHEAKFCEDLMAAGDIQLETRKPFNPLDVDFGDIDSHQVGVPFLSFFKKLSQNKNISLKEIFLKLLHFKFNENNSYKCYLESKTFHYKTVMFKQFFDELRESLNVEDQKKFDQLVFEKSLNKGFSLEKEFFKKVFQDQVTKENFLSDLSTLRCEFEG